MSKDFIILGGGVSGLVAGYELLKRVIKLQFLKPKIFLVSLLQLLSLKNFPIDFGPHVFHSFS